MVISNFAALARVGLKKVIDLHSTQQTNQYANIVQVLSTRQEYERFHQISDFPYASVTAEMGGVGYEDLLKGYTKDWYPLMRAIGYRISFQADFTDLYNKIKNPGRKMAQTLQETLELGVANILNNGFTNTSAYQGPDGVALFSTAHPLASSTSANTPSTPIALSSTALEQAIQEIRTQKSHRGKPMPVTGKMRMIVPPQLEMLAARITGATQLAQTADNDPNVAGKRCTAYVNDWITSSGTVYPWFILANQDENPLFLLRRIPRDLITETDIDNLSYKFVAYEEWVTGWMDWRRTWGTQGA